MSEKTLTPAQIEKYNTGVGGFGFCPYCGHWDPYCGHWDITLGGLELLGDEGWQQCYCCNCDGQWTHEYDIISRGIR